MASFFQPEYELKKCRDGVCRKNLRDVEQKHLRTKCICVFPKLLVIEVKVFNDDGDCIVEPFNIPETLNLSSFLPISLNKDKSALE